MREIAALRTFAEMLGWVVILLSAILGTLVAAALLIEGCYKYWKLEAAWVDFLMERNRKKENAANRKT